MAADPAGILPKFYKAYRWNSIPNQEDHGFHPWVNWSSGAGCSPLVGVSWEPWALPVGLHRQHSSKVNTTAENAEVPHLKMLKVDADKTFSASPPALGKPLESDGLRMKIYD